ncbi:myeloperoxidase-like [Ostrea edulis]|uniref:myeloperoxidase-like n=1 Tax=Ostrea edulis TaxID=37623 RepID=UPI0020945DAB|nr:myeloperoxidase-like [Ostrea edulis]
MARQFKNMCRIFFLAVAILGVQGTTKICESSPLTISCNLDYKYRSIDGSCNNLNHPDRGQTHTSQRRFLLPDYDDGYDALRHTGYIHSLPSAREVSNLLFQNNDKTPTLDPKINVLHMSFGQFLDHDLILTPVTSGIFSCCGRDKHKPPCIPITIPPNDPFFKQNCMPLKRSASILVKHGKACVREQINDVTSYVDASNVYGSSEKKARNLRTFKSGTLRQEKKGLPKGGKKPCVFEDSVHDYCQEAGDKRVNVVPNLGSMHLLFVRYHNYIAGKMAKLNPLWDDEKLYQETRVIVTAVIQHVVYREYLPLVLGHDVMMQYELFPMPHGFDSVYDEEIDASTRNVFGAAAFRFGHSQIPNHQKQFNKAYSSIVNKNIEDTYHNPHMCIAKGGKGCDGVLRWELAEQTTKSDGVFESGIRDKLFMTSAGASLDLPAINLQRGRDHGIPPYWKWRRFCGLCPDSLSDHTDANKDKLLKVYKNIHEIELYAGAMTEKPVNDGLVGPTFACLIGKQFSLYKKGDRFWYENERTNGFTKDQLKEIKKTTLSSVICQTMEVDTITPNAFLVESSTNKRIKCKSMTHPEWLPWWDIEDPVKCD